jgi:hypothetical protein
MKKGTRLYKLDKNVEYFTEGYEALFLTFFDFEIVDIYYTDADYLIFKDDIIDLYEQRKKAKEEGDVSKDARLKSILVNLYGLFGLRYERKIEESYTTYELESLLEFTEGFRIEDIEKLITIENVAKITLNKPNKKLSILVINDTANVVRYERLFAKQQSIPPFATATTSHGRFWLLSNIYYIVLNLNGEVYYVDTDSIFTNIELETSKDLGRLKLEATIDKAYFLAPKTYITIINGNVNIKAKGTGRSLVREMVIQSLKSEFKIVEKKALSEDRTTYKAVGKDGWLYYLDEEVDYFETYKDVLVKAMDEILDEDIRKQLKQLLEEAKDEEDEGKVEAEESVEAEAED